MAAPGWHQAFHHDWSADPVPLVTCACNYWEQRIRYMYIFMYKDASSFDYWCIYLNWPLRLSGHNYQLSSIQWPTIPIKQYKIIQNWAPVCFETVWSQSDNHADIPWLVYTCLLYVCYTFVHIKYVYDVYDDCQWDNFLLDLEWREPKGRYIGLTPYWDTIRPLTMS